MTKMGEKRKEPKKPMKRKTPKDYLLDNLWSQIVRSRDGFTCVLCGKTRYQTQIDAHHIVGRSYYETRWLIENGTSLCKACHDRVGRLPREQEHLIKKTIGKDREEQLEIIAITGIGKKRDREEIKAHLKEMLKGLEE